MITTKIDPELTKKYLKPKVYAKRGKYSRKYLFKCICGCEETAYGRKDQKYILKSHCIKHWKERKAVKK